jgi:hypothetical protein
LGFFADALRGEVLFPNRVEVVSSYPFDYWNTDSVAKAEQGLVQWGFDDETACAHEASTFTWR